MKNSAILLVSCPDAKGEVASIADFVYRHNGNILHADEHADEESGLFLMRVEFDPKDFDIDLSDKNLADFARHFLPIADKFKMNTTIKHKLCAASCDCQMSVWHYVAKLGGNAGGVF